MGPGRDDNRRWKSAHDTVHGEILPLIRSRLKLRQEGASREGVPNDMLAKLLDAYSKESGAESDFSAEDFDKVLGANVVELLFAGYNTVVNVITAGTYLFATNPSELAKLRRELDTVLKGRVPTWDDMKNLKFTRWSFFETLRIAPPALLLQEKLQIP